MTYLLHLPFPIPTESPHWLQAQSRSGRFPWQTGQVGMLPIRARTPACLCPREALWEMFLPLHLLRAREGRLLSGKYSRFFDQLWGFFEAPFGIWSSLCRCTGHVFTGQQIFWKKISGHLKMAVTVLLFLHAEQIIWKCLRLTAETRFWQSNFLWWVQKKIVAIEKSSVSLKAIHKLMEPLYTIIRLLQAPIQLFEIILYGLSQRRSFILCSFWQ